MNTRSTFPLGLLLLFAASCFAQPKVLTWHYDNMRTGANTQETILTPSNVVWTRFGKLFSQSVDGVIVGQALYLPGITIPNKGVHNVVYVATMNDSVYAFDADNNSGPNASPLWKTRVLAPGAEAVPVGVQGGGATTAWTQVGVVSTPVIDTSTRILYLVAKDYLNGTVSNRLYGLSVSTGAQRFIPIRISATFTRGGRIYTFNNSTQVNRPALLLNNGHIYVAFGSNGGNGAEQGWVISYTAATSSTPTPKFAGAFNDEPGKCCGAIWQKGGGLSADSNGYVYAASGDGSFAAGTNLGQSIFKLNQTSTSLALADWFTPYNWNYLLNHDLDLNTSVLVLPQQPGPHPYLAIASGKVGTIYVVDRANMGHVCTTCTTKDTQIVQELPSATGPEPGAFVYWNSTVYSSGGSSPIKAWRLSGGLLSSSPLARSVQVANGHSPVLSSNGSSNGILWQLEGVVSSAVLDAFDALTLDRIYSAKQSGGRDSLPAVPHFAQLMEVNGKVYVGTNSSLVVFGLF